MYLTNQPENLSILEQVLEQTDAVFFIYEIANNQFRYISPVFNEIWERDRQEFYQDPGKLVATLHPEDQPDIKKIWKKGQYKTKKKQEFRILTPEGKSKWLSVSPCPILLEDGVAAISGFAEDISEAKDNIYTLQKFAAKKNSSLEILSHDLAGPLNVIRQLSDFLLEATRPYNNDEVIQDLELIRETCSRSVNLIKDLVNQEFSESVDSGIRKERHDLVLKLQVIVDNYRQSERAIVKTFNLKYSSHPIFMEMDEVKFMQVINNLISNAIKFTPEGGSIDITVEDKEDLIVIAIADTGIGIPEKYHPVLFDRFTPARRPGLRGEPTVGLGMSIIKRIVEMHQGRIRFESKENQGSIFYIEVPKT